MWQEREREPARDWWTSHGITVLFQLYQKQLFAGSARFCIFEKPHNHSKGIAMPPSNNKSSLHQFYTISDKNTLVRVYLEEAKTAKTIQEIAESTALSEGEVRESILQLIDDRSVRLTSNKPKRYTINPLGPAQNPSYSVSLDDLKKAKSITDKNGPSFKFDAERIDLLYHGQNVRPCFNVSGVADAFISVIDSISSLKMDSISMLGIFAAWGRGKSYLFDLVKQKISARPKDEIHYDVIEFNAWKYQSVPAIWASLFETIYHQKPWWFRLWFMIKRNTWPLLKDLLICFSVPFIVWLITYIPALETWADKYKHITLWSFLISLFAYAIKLFSNQQKGVLEIIRKHVKGVSFAEHLGVQAEIEKNLTEYLKQWISDRAAEKKKVILYVEDVDRCESQKMLDIIESLRTILEQPDIRKRLIVVLSIDPEKLWRAIELKYKGLYDGEKLYETITNHFDKLFTASITLSELNNEQEVEFISALEKSPFENLIQRALEPARHNERDDFGSSETTDSTAAKNTSASINHKIVTDLLSESVQSLGHLHLTPRQLSCTYYRTLLAINLLALLPGISTIDITLTNQIIVRSYLFSRKDLILETPYESVLKMVLPYSTKELLRDSDR